MGVFVRRGDGNTSARPTTQLKFRGAGESQQRDESQQRHHASTGVGGVTKAVGDWMHAGAGLCSQPTFSKSKSVNDPPRLRWRSHSRRAATVRSRMRLSLEARCFPNLISLLVVALLVRALEPPPSPPTRRHDTWRCHRQS